MQLEQQSVKMTEAPDTGALRFHCFMGCALVLFVAATGVIWHTAGVYVDHWRSNVVAVTVVLIAAMPLPMYWHQKGREDRREAALAMMWAMVFAVTLALPVSALARLGGPLQDAAFARIDGALGVSVPGIAAWAGRHGVSGFLSHVYGLLVPLMAFAVLVPGLSGKWRETRVFVLGNVLAFLLGLPLFTLFPAIGPWVAYGVHATAEQLKCQADLLTMRGAGPAVSVAGIVCFPSFHVIWAILCAYAFSGFRWLRVPVAVLAGLIVLSTMTTGWHYFADVLAGGVVAGAAIAIARWVSVPAAAKQACEADTWATRGQCEVKSVA